MSLYPTPAGQRIPYDRDGSAAFDYGDSVALASLSTANMQTINNENADSFAWTGGHGVIGVVFSHAWDLTGYFISQHFTPGAVETSTNTTNGQDGTWVGHGNFADANPGVASAAPGYRSSITSLSVAGIVGIRFTTAQGNTDNWCASLHLYGTPTSGANPDSLRIWQPVTGAEVTTVLDFGDIARGTAATQQFRVHNQSATKTASTITVSMEALTDASPSLIGQYQLSADNVTFANSISIPNLGPGATSAVLYVKDTVAAGAATGVWAARIVAAAGTFA